MTPSTSSDRRARWPGGYEQAVRFLVSQGYTLVHDPETGHVTYTWRKPTPEHVVLPEESDALCYLMEEWDWGGVEC